VDSSVYSKLFLVCGCVYSNKGFLGVELNTPCLKNNSDAKYLFKLDSLFSVRLKYCLDMEEVSKGPANQSLPVRSSFSTKMLGQARWAAWIRNNGNLAVSLFFFIQYYLKSRSNRFETTFRSFKVVQLLICNWLRSWDSCWTVDIEDAFISRF
jgi:hypothetical protein